MKKKLVGYLVPMLFGAGLALAQDPATAPAADAAAAPAEPAPAASSDAARHDELRKLRDTMEEALNQRDLDALVANVDENLVFTTMNGDVARGRQGIRDYFAKMMEGPDKIVDTITSDFAPDDLSIFYGDSTAVAFGSSKDHYVLTDGRKFDIAGRWTATLVNQDGRWLIAAFHYSTNVFDNPILKLQRKYLLLGGGAGALLLGLLGWFLGRRAGNRATT